MTESAALAIKNAYNIDWSFATHSSRGHITSLHPYPARFIPSIPKTILDMVKDMDKKKILDPFAGCGTTLVEGLYEGYEVIGVDVNGLSCLLQRVYTYPYSNRDLDDLEDLLGCIIGKFETEITYKQSTIPNLDHWFSLESQAVLELFLTQIRESKYKDQIKDLANFCVSRIIVKISNQQSDTQYRAINKNQNREQILKVICDSFRTVIERFRNEDITSLRATVIQGDSREEKTYEGIKDVDLIITSPPYPNAYEYWLYHKYRMFWLEMDPIWSRTREIGARPFYSGSGKLDEFDFQKDIARVMASLYKITTPDAIQFWVVGDSIIKGRKIDNSEVINKACKQTGWKVIDKIERNLSRTRSSFQGIGRQIKEDILVIVKDNES